MSFEGKVALVTGGASGIGYATAEAFAALGASVMIADRDEVEGAAAAARMGASFVPCDITKPDEVEQMVAATVATFGGLDMAANVAGGAGAGDRPGNTIVDTTEEQWDGTMSVNLRATWLCLRAEIGYMAGAGGGAIVNVASVAGFLGDSDSSVAYGVAKAGVIHLTRMAAVEAASQGIRVNAVAPGLTATPAVVRAFGKVTPVPRDHLIQRPVRPEEQAAAITWLCSEAAAMVTGHTLPVDGGWLAR